MTLHLASRLVLSLWLAPAAAGAATCGGSLDATARRQIESDGLVLVYAPRPAPLLTDRHFALDVVVCGASVTALRVDADMPAHRHGMNYRATVRPVGDGRFEAQGLLLHMPGRWRFIFDVQAGGKTARLTHAVDIE